MECFLAKILIDREIFKLEMSLSVRKDLIPSSNWLVTWSKASKYWEVSYTTYELSITSLQVALRKLGNLSGSPHGAYLWGLPLMGTTTISD